MITEVVCSLAATLRKRTQEQTHPFSAQPSDPPQVYQMSTNDRRQALAAQGLAGPAEYPHVYRMSTNITFLHQKRRFRIETAAFLHFWDPRKGRDTSLYFEEERDPSKKLGKT